MNKTFKKIVMILTAVYIVAFIVLNNVFEEFMIQNRFYVLGITLVVYGFLSFDTIKEGFEKLKEKDFFNEDTLVIIASIGAFVVGSFPNVQGEIDVGAYYEGLVVVLLYILGEMFEDYAVDKSKEELSYLTKIQNSQVRILDSKGKYKFIKIEDVKVNDIIYIFPGEEVPLDIKLIDKKAILDQKFLTGESLPIEKDENDVIYSGSINLNTSISGIVVKENKDSTISKIVKLIEQASENKSNTEKFINKFASIYTPIVIGISILTFLLGGIIESTVTGNSMWMKWLYQACEILVIACPCAIVISVPIVYVTSLIKASKNGILIKGSNYLDTIYKSKTICFDKTGTLTTGNLKVKKFVSLTDDYTNERILEIASNLEQNSNHPIAEAIKNEALNQNIPSKIVKISEIAGLGVSGTIDGINYKIGNSRLLKEGQKDIPEIETTNVLVLFEDKLIGYILFEDDLKENIKNTLEQIKNTGFKNIVVLSGDNQYTVQAVAKELDLNNYYYGLLPDQKLEKINDLKLKDKVIFVGDGINDAPSIMTASCGIGMGKLGSDVVIQSSDVVIIDDDISKIPFLKKLANRAHFTIILNIVLAIAVKLSVMILALSSIEIPLILAIFADVGMLIICIIISFINYKIKIK